MKICEPVLAVSKFEHVSLSTTPRFLVLYATDNSSNVPEKNRSLIVCLWCKFTRIEAVLAVMVCWKNTLLGSQDSGRLMMYHS